MRRQEAAFTLIELVMVIVILGILTAVAVPRYLNMVQDSQVAAVGAAVQSTSSAIAIAAARHRSTGVAPTAAQIILEIPGAVCLNGVIIHGGRVSVPLLQMTGGAALTACTTTVVGSVGVGTYSSA